MLVTAEQRTPWRRTLSSTVHSTSAGSAALGWLYMSLGSMIPPCRMGSHIESPEKNRPNHKRHALCPFGVHSPLSQANRVCEALSHLWGEASRGKLKVTPVVNSQSGAPWLKPRLIPTSKTTLGKGDCQSTPRRAELLAACPWTLSPLTSPTNRNCGTTGSSVISPQTAKGRVPSRSTPPPAFRWKVKGDTLWLTIAIPSKPSRLSSGLVDGNSGPSSTAMLTP